MNRTNPAAGETPAAAFPEHPPSLKAPRTANPWLAIIAAASIWQTAWGEFVIADHQDLPGANQVRLIELDQHVLVASEFRHKHEAILLLAHPSRKKLQEALSAIRIEADPLPAIFDIGQSAPPECIQYKTDNVFKRIDIRKGAAERDLLGGEFERLFRDAAHVVEGVYRTGPQEHVYLETQGMIAFREGDRMTVTGSVQCPYYVLAALTHAFGRAEDSFRVVQTPVGGGFGGKEDFPSLLAVHAALLAEKSGRPVKIVYDRLEDMAVTTKRHPAVIRHRTAVDREGRLLAMQIAVLMDGGAYVTLSPVVLSRGCIHAAGPYSCEHVHIHGEVRLTNSPPYGAFRGFGAPQTQFAMECHMDAIARRVGIDRVEIRRRNLLRPGQTTATGQRFDEPVDLPGLLDRALREADRDAKKTAHAAFNASHPYLRRGLGVATFFHGSGFTGSGEVHLASRVWVDALPDGTVEVLTAQTDMGQGTATILAQIAAARLRVPVENVRVAQPDTARVPNSGPTVASRTAMVVGRLVERACDDLAGQLGPSNVDGGNRERIADSIRAWHASNPGRRLRGTAEYEKPAEIEWDDDRYRGDAYAAYSWGAYVAEVEVDVRTYQAKVTDFVAAQEVGRVLNPTLARGQVQGGVAQAIGWALYEDVVLAEGAMRNAQLTNYTIPASTDLPPIRVIFEEHRSRYGPGGAKGIGEMPMDGPAPAVASAIADALGAAIAEIPITPERLMETLDRSSGTQKETACPP
ncbi:MAG: molybdopterin-dependent oxidoreductase [Planctomycetes bacterium]|nr:molybdopterin-dependent oxidoreductase [Planctomycetota bacterium]